MNESQMFEKVVFERVRLAAQQRFGPMQIESRLYQADVVADMLVGEITAHFLKNAVHEEVSRETVKEVVEQERVFKTTLEFPSNWWEHVKERFAPQWFCRRWPVKRFTYDIERHYITKKYITENVRVREYTHLCPHLAAAAPTQDHVTFMTTKRPLTASQYRHGDEW